MVVAPVALLLAVAGLVAAVPNPIMYTDPHIGTGLSPLFGPVVSQAQGGLALALAATLLAFRSAARLIIAFIIF
jgi:hypothetical protein